MPFPRGGKPGLALGLANVLTYVFNFGGERLSPPGGLRVAFLPRVTRSAQSQHLRYFTAARNSGSCDRNNHTELLPMFLSISSNFDATWMRTRGIFLFLLHFSF